MKVVGHRGAAGLATENTLESITAAISAGVDAVEFDVRVTKDGKLVLFHDDTLERLCGIDEKVSDLTLSKLESTQTTNGEYIPSLEAAISASGDTPLFIEGKGNNWARPLARIIKKHGVESRCKVISFNHRELYTFSKLKKDVPCYAVEHHNPFDAINAARIYGFEGIDLNYWILNPLAYWLARRHKYDVAVYTVNKTWIASFLRIFYPNIALTTNFPNHMQFVRPKHLRVKPSRKGAKK